MDYGRGEFYYSEKWGELTAIADGTTTLTDVADAIAAGTASAYHEALAAHYFAQAADYLAGVAEGRVVDAERGHPEPALEDDNGQIPWLRDDSELAVAEMAREFAEAARREAHEVAREAVDREDDARRWADAEDEDAYHAAGAAAALAADVNEAWRKAVDVEYDQRCADYGNDGRPEDDRHISTEDKAAQAAAVAAIAERTGLPTGAVWDAVRDVTDRYARDHTDTATLGQPDWDQVADSWADMLAEQQAYQDGGARAAAAAALEAAAADREITGTYRDMGWTAEQIAQAQDSMTVAQAQDALDRLAAYEAAVSPPAADPGTDTHNLVLAPAGASPTPTAELDTWAAKNPAGEWAANEDVVARFESDAALTAEAGDGAAALEAHQQRLAEAAVTRDDVTLAHPPAGTDAPLHQHNAILNRGQLAELTAAAAGQVDDGYTQEPEEQLAGQLIANAQDRGDPPPPEGWSRWAHTQVEQATEDLRDNAATDTADARAADPVLWGSVAADLLDDLDQARAQSEAGDIPAEREHEQAEYEEQIELAQGGDPFPATSTRWRGADDASGLEGPFSADPVLAAHGAELLSDLDGTSDDTYPGDNSAYWDAVSAAEEQLPDDLDAATDTAPALYDDGPPLKDLDGAAATTLAADESVPDELARGGDPTLAAKTAAWMATEAAATEQWLAAETAGFTPVDSHDHIVERHDRDQQYAEHPAPNPWNTPAKRDGVGVAPSAAEQEEITRDGERGHDDSYGTGDPDPHPGTAVQQPPDEEPPGKARAAKAVAAAHQAVADTQRLNAQRAEQGSAVPWLAADDQAGTVGDEVELGSQDEALPPA